MAGLKPQTSGRGQEPPMYLQRPSTGKSQDVRHILARTFRDLYTRDAVRPETVKNLQVSKGGDDPYHEKYVESLQKVYTEWQQRMDEAAMLERHIMQAQARAMSADERELNKTSKSCDNYSSLGLPPVRAHFRACIDNHLLEKYDLLTPSDYMVQEPLPVPAPQGPKVPDYARETLASRQHSRQNGNARPETPLAPMPAPGESMELPTFVSEDFQYVTSEDSFRETQKTYPKKKSWKEYMSEEQREEERAALAMLHAKVNYLQNPRHVPPSAPPGGRTLIQPSHKTPKEIGIQKEPDQIPTDSVVFLASPNIVEFKDYKVGEVYEISLELKNVSTVMRQCRVLPPSSNIFSVGLGQFPGENGLVAPGMSCKYSIRFAPDSLKDYDDSITVQTQASKPLIVSIRGRRNPPVLTLPSVLDLGSCLVGGVQATQLLIKNEGGPGRFCLMTRNKWPTTTIRTVIPNLSKITVKAPPFEIHPATFELRANEATVLEVLFNPNYDKVYEQAITIACDNCHACHFTLKGEGEIARIGLADVEFGLSEPKVGELNDKTAENLLKFDDLNPFTYTERMVKVMNFCKVELPFQWMVYKPIMQVGMKTETNEGASQGNHCEDERVPDLDSVFSVYPNNGILKPSETAQFKFTFAPPTEGDFHSAIHMMLQHVPPRKEASKSTDDVTRPLTGDDAVSVRIEEENHNLMGNVAFFRDLTGLEVEVKGKCIPLNVVLHPYAIFMPGTALAGSTIKRLFTMANHSYSAITFQWEPYTDSYLLEVEPPFGELDPGMAMDLEISITGIVPGKINHTLMCYVMNMAEPLHLHVQAEFKGPELRIGQPSIDFGLVRVGTKAERAMTLINDSQMPVKFNIVDNIGETETDDDMAPSDLHFSEMSGELLPLERRSIRLFFKPTCPRTFKRVCHVEYEGGTPCFIGVYGEAQNPVVCFLECEKSLPEVYLDVPVVFNVVMHNQTLLPSTFKWGQIEGTQKDDCKVEFQEEEGHIKSWEQKTISIAFTPFKAESYSEVRLPCRVQGQKEEIYLNISCDVRTLQVTYKTSTDSHLLSDDRHLDFGTGVQLGSAVTRYVHICNQTAITAPYTVVVEYLTSNIPQPPDSNESGTAKSQRRNLLSRTPNLADPLSKPPQKVKDDYNKIVLGKKRGAAFTVRPAHGMLQPFGEQIIEVCGLGDMWGKYQDNLIFKVGELEDVLIPMNMEVTGCPLSFQLTAGQAEHKPVVRFGTHVSGVAATTRRLKINNSSPNDIRVDWQVFENEGDDDKLIDFITCFGRPFPPRDSLGNEIIPKREPGALPPPPNMDLITNSPDTSVLTSSVVSRAQNDSILSSTLMQDDERPNIVSCFLRPHGGAAIERPYSMTPTQLVIPGQKSKTVDLTFTPLPTSEVGREMDCFGFALGYLSLDHEDSDVSHICRKEAYEADCLRLDFTAHLKPALLSVEETDDEGMRYRSAMSDLLHDKKVTSESMRVSSTMLSNNTLTPLNFKMAVNDPFVLVDLEADTTVDNSDRALETKYCTLNPGHNMMAKVALCVSTDLLMKRQWQSEVEEEEEENELDPEDSGSNKLTFEDELVIEFDNGAQQRVPLFATLAVPQIELSTSVLDFGTCLVGQTRELEMFIVNKTASHSYWNAFVKQTSETCDKDTFQVVPNRGMLEAHITHVSNSKMFLKVYFTAKHSEEYEAVILFKGQLGESHQRLRLVGHGSYDGKHEAFLNV